MSSTVALLVVLIYFLLLLGISFYTSRNANNESFFIGNRGSKWWVVAFGMVGTSLSGITFISVPGMVGNNGFNYFSVVIGYIIGYFAVAHILLPVYYGFRLTTIYTYLKSRLGNTAYRTGALFFILSRTLGATLRLYLVIKVLERFVLSGIGISFQVTAVVLLLLILLYTYRGGVKTIVWTDTLQTSFMLLALFACTIYVFRSLDMNPKVVLNTLQRMGMTKMFNSRGADPDFLLKQILGGAFITLSMTGLDQEMMQKNISVRTLKDAQKNMITLSFLQAIAVFVFLCLGALLYLYALKLGASFEPDVNGGQAHRQLLMHGSVIPADDLFPYLVFHSFPPFVSLLFLVGLVSALFPSADGALTALTSSFCIDILGMLEPGKLNRSTEANRRRMRLAVHYSFAAIFLLCVFLFRTLDNGSILQLLLVLAGYTYGPLLALFAFALFTRRRLVNVAIPVVCVLGPLLCFLLKSNESRLFQAYRIGNELLIINAVITFALLSAFSKTVRK